MILKKNFEISYRFNQPEENWRFEVSLINKLQGIRKIHKDSESKG